MAKVMSNYNKSLDCIALAMCLGRAGRTRLAAKVFAKAINDPSAVSAINTINASNELAAKRLQASARVDAKRTRLVAEDLSDEDIENILDGEDVDADLDGDSVEVNLDDEDGDDVDADFDLDDEDDDLGDDDLEADLDEDLDEDEAQEEFARVVANMSRRRRA